VLANRPSLEKTQRGSTEVHEKNAEKKSLPKYNARGSHHHRMGGQRYEGSPGPGPGRDPVHVGVAPPGAGGFSLKNPSARSTPLSGSPKNPRNRTPSSSSSFVGRSRQPWNERVGAQERNNERVGAQEWSNERVVAQEWNNDTTVVHNDPLPLNPLPATVGGGRRKKPEAAAGAGKAGGKGRTNRSLVVLNGSSMGRNEAAGGINMMRNQDTPDSNLTSAFGPGTDDHFPGPPVEGAASFQDIHGIQRKSTPKAKRGPVRAGILASHRQQQEQLPLPREPPSSQQQQQQQQALNLVKPSPQHIVVNRNPKARTAHQPAAFVAAQQHQCPPVPVKYAACSSGSTSTSSTTNHSDVGETSRWEISTFRHRPGGEYNISGPTSSTSSTAHRSSFLQKSDVGAVYDTPQKVATAHQHHIDGDPVYQYAVDGTRRRKNPIEDQCARVPAPGCTPQIPADEEARTLHARLVQADEEHGLNEPRMQCPHCSRSFFQRAFERHVKICKNVFVKKRKAFNAVEQRMEEEQKQALRKETLQEQEDGGALVKNQKWKAKSEAFRNAIKHARLAAVAERTGGPMPELAPAPAEADDRVPCPYCNRRFSAETAERHIPKCKETKAKPTRLMAGARNPTSLHNKKAGVLHPVVARGRLEEPRLVQEGGAPPSSKTKMNKTTPLPSSKPSGGTVTVALGGSKPLLGESRTRTRTMGGTRGGGVVARKISGAISAS